MADRILLFRRLAQVNLQFPQSLLSISNAPKQAFVEEILTDNLGIFVAQSKRQQCVDLHAANRFFDALCVLFFNLTTDESTF